MIFSKMDNPVLSEFCKCHTSVQGRSTTAHGKSLGEDYWLIKISKKPASQNIAANARMQLFCFVNAPWREEEDLKIHNWRIVQVWAVKRTMSGLLVKGT